MAISRKLDEFRVRIRRHQLQQYFSSVRCEVQKELKELEAVEQAKEEEVLRWMHENTSNCKLDFSNVRLFLNYNAGRLSLYFAQHFTRCILDHFQYSEQGLDCLCILLENCEFEWQESGERLNCLVSEDREKEDLYAGVFIVYRLFGCSRRKETFLWITGHYEGLVKRLGCNEAFMLLLLELSQYDELMPSEQVLLHLLHGSRKECSVLAFVRICQLASYYRSGSPQLVFQVVRWAVDSLKEQSHPQCIQASLQVLTVFSFKLDTQQTQVIVRSGLVDHIVSLCEKVLVSQRILLLRCLCDFLSSLPDNIFQSLLPQLKLQEMLADALSLDLPNIERFRILSCLSLVFAADPSSLRRLCRLNLLPHLLMLSESRFTQLREISCMILEEYSLDY